MSKLVIGCGYLGRRVAARWIEAGQEVFALTRSEANARQLHQLGIRPIIGDVCEPETLRSLPAVDSVLFAVGFDRSSGRSQHSVYVDGLSNVLNQIGSRCERFIYVSSSSVYGQSEGEWVDETSPCEPAQPGGQCCLAAESRLLSFAHDRQASATSAPIACVLRLSGIYGPDRLLSRITSLRSREPLSGRGDAWLNLIHVDDAATAVLAAEQRGQPNQTYLISDDRPILRSEYYHLLARRTNSPEPVFSEDLPAKRGSGGLNKRCSNRKARTELGLVLAYPSINEGLPHAIQNSPSAHSLGEPPASRQSSPSG